MKNNQALISAAFQDHIIKKLDLNRVIAEPNVLSRNKNPIKVTQIKSKVDSGLPKSKFFIDIIDYMSKYSNMIILNIHD